MRWVYVIAAITSLYLNVFVLVVQSFVKVSALNVLAPTQSEPPFAITQAAVLAIFILIAFIAVVKFRPVTTVRVQSVCDVRFSNRLIWVKPFRLSTKMNVTRGLVLLSGIGTRALPSWDSRTRSYFRAP